MTDPIRRLVLCMDGTWQNPYQLKEREDKTQVLKPSNVLKLARAVRTRSRRDEAEQITYYDHGIGAMVRYPGLANRLDTFVDSKLGGAWGAGFETNLEEAVRFLTHNHRAGDQVFVFGFSRGAAQARALTRYLDWLGGVPAKGDAYFGPLFFKHYIETHGAGDPGDVATASGRRPDEPIVPVAVELLAVWDTVMALGSRFAATQKTSAENRSFHVASTPARCVRNARQALAIDERRYDFRPEVWRAVRPQQTLEQRWFVGSHANVGGGYVHDGLANVPFQWLLGEAVRLGLDIDEAFAKHYAPFEMDRCYDSMTRFYGALEFIRARRGKGRRRLTGFPQTAHLTLDPSVIRRMLRSTDQPRRADRYRPAPVIEFLASLPDPEGYLESIGLSAEERTLPADVREDIERRRR